MINELVNQLMVDEGSVTNDSGRHIAYLCPADKWTIGYGIEVQDHGLSEKEAENLLRQRVMVVVDEVHMNYPFIKSAPLPIKLSFYNMAYNLGITRLSKFKKMIAALEATDYLTASEEAKDSQWYSQVGERAERIVNIFKDSADKHFS
jgi:lysozyme|tara:strand:- start:8 stop:451 length:444 start_codon:yes stop_codon:yes gene_type:complete